MSSIVVCRTSWGQGFLAVRLDEFGSGLEQFGTMSIGPRNLLARGVRVRGPQTFVEPEIYKILIGTERGQPLSPKPRKALTP